MFPLFLSGAPSCKPWSYNGTAAKKEKKKKGNVLTEVFIQSVKRKMFPKQPVLLCSPLWVQDLSPRVLLDPQTTWSPTLALALESYRGSLSTAV